MIVFINDYDKDYISSVMGELKRSFVPCCALSLSAAQDEREGILYVSVYRNISHIVQCVYAAKGHPLTVVCDKTTTSLPEGVGVIIKTTPSAAALQIKTMFNKTGAYEPSCGLLRFSEGEVFYNNIPLPLTPSEKLILSLLTENHHKYVSDETVAKCCGKGHSCLTIHSVRTHVADINRKTIPILGHKLILAVRNRGYMLNE